LIGNEEARVPAKMDEDAVARQIVTERITVGLVPKTGGELRELQERTGLSKTDIVNRAITLYAFMEAQLGAGHELLVRRDTGEVELVRFL
jgi:hypothetical protein